MSYWIKVILAIAFMVLFQFIPAPAPLTTAGMQVIGIFIGILLLVATVDVTWPVFVTLIVIPFFMSNIYGETATPCRTL